MTSNNEGDTFYRFFDRLSNGGRVYDFDLSTVAGPVPINRLLQAEINQRRVWMQKWTQVRAEYDRTGVPRISTTDEFLSQRILIPCLKLAAVSSRTQLNEQRANYDYANEIVEWEEFEQNVTAFQPVNRNLVRSPNHNFTYTKGKPRRPLQNEKQETSYLTDQLDELMEIGLFSTFEENGFKNGEPDWWTTDSNGAILMVVEMKSTHNLPVPMNANRVAELWNERGANGQQSTRSQLMRKPIAQLVADMCANNVRYGALSSGTRSYFFHIRQESESKREVLCMSNAWFIGQHNFLRAWAYINHLSITSEKVSLTLKSGKMKKPKIVWKDAPGNGPQAGTPQGDMKRAPGSGYGLRPRASNKGNSGVKGNNRSMMKKKEDYTEETSNGLPEVEYNSLEIIRPLASGRCGTVLLAKWQGREVALKQFDMDRRYESFEKEVAAYEYLKPAWGSLVVTPLFVCEHPYGWIKYIGLQLGRSPNEDDDADSFWAENEKVLDTLEKEYKFRHEDADGGQNMVYIWEEKTKSERLVAIDLESYNILE